MKHARGRRAAAGGGRGGQDEPAGDRDCRAQAAAAGDTDTDTQPGPEPRPEPEPSALTPVLIRTPTLALTLPRWLPTALHWSAGRRRHTRLTSRRCSASSVSAPCSHGGARTAPLRRSPSRTSARGCSPNEACGKGAPRRPVQPQPRLTKGAGPPRRCLRPPAALLGIL